MTTGGQADGDEIDEPEVRAAAVERLTFFSDAVVAIALTLLALDLPLPSGTTNRQVLGSLQAHWNDYFVFVISFVAISAHWRAHHQFFRYVAAPGGRLMPMTMVWLFAQVITPFATRVIAGDGAFVVRFDFYAIVQIASSLTFVLMVHQVHRHRLFRPSTPRILFRRAYLGSAALLAGFVVSIPISLFTHWAYACWVAVPALSRLFTRLWGSAPAVPRRRSVGSAEGVESEDRGDTP